VADADVADVAVVVADPDVPPVEAVARDAPSAAPTEERPVAPVDAGVASVRSKPNSVAGLPASA
jgi:hypothetical protein